MKHLFCLTDTFLSQFLQEVFRRRRFPLLGVDFQDLFTRLKQKMNQTFSWVDWESTKGQIKKITESWALHSACTVRSETRCHLSVRQSEEELPVEASGPSQRRVDGVQPVRRSDHHDLASAVQPVHQSQERRHDGAAGRMWSEHIFIAVVLSWMHICCHLSLFCFHLWIWSCLLDRTGARPSISSKKMMDGRIRYACGRHTPTHEVVKISDGGNKN